MRKTRVYRPRRGLRFRNGRRGVSPAAGFVGGGLPITPVTIGGSVQSSTEQNDGSPGPVISSSVSYGSIRPSGIYNRVLLGTGMAGTGRPYSTVMTPVTASVPSWTNRDIANQAFVSLSLFKTGSNELLRNYFRSGTQAVENSAVPASGNLFYSKQQRYQTIVVKHTASFFDTVPAFSGVIVPSVFAPSTGALVTIITGSNMPSMSSSFRYPATIRIDVPQQGKLVDIKVWVELVHLSGGTGRYHPLSTLGIALRSPNVKWGNAHPVRNDPKFLEAFRNPTFAAVLDGLSGFNDAFFPVANFYSDTFLLWEGIGIIDPSVGRGPQDALGFHTRTATFRPTWDRDRGMRTIFADGAPVRNPRELLGTSPSGNFVGAPSFGAGINSAFGMNVPWTSDKTVFPATESFQANGSPPRGWLTAPGSVAAVNEWPTTGVNYGAEMVRPVYPMLEPIYQRKVIGSEAPLIGTIEKSVSGIDIPQDNPTTWNGFRPGLRGTEINGTWELLICQAGIIANGVPSGESKRVDTYFRQVRLEITYETGGRPNQVRASSQISPRRAGTPLYSSISGSAYMFTDLASGSWDGYVSTQHVDVPGSSELGRTFGVRLNTGSFNPSNFALVYRLTGTLAEKSGSAPGWLLNNQFGMPQIPESSASLVPYVPYVNPTVPPAQGILTQAKTLDGPKTLSDLAADLNPPLTLVQMASAFVSSSAT